MTTRRELLVMLTGTSLVFSLPGCGSGKVLDLRPIFGREVHAIGAAWRALHPQVTEQQLMDDLFPDGLPSDPTTWVIERIQADFAAANIVRLRGWRLARTEVRVAALVDIVAPEKPAEHHERPTNE